MRLTDVDVLKLTFCRECTLRDDGCPEKAGDECDVQAVYHIEHCAPTVDVVRCRECKYYSGSWLGRCEMISARLAAYQRDMRWDDEFYCAFGERKDGADNG
jgi:hypothetical protein